MRQEMGTGKIWGRRRALALLMAALMIFALGFTGCNSDPEETSLSDESSSGDDTPARVITIYAYGDSATAAYWKDKADSFAAGSPEKLEFVIKTGLDIAKSVRSDILAGAIPDIVYLPSDDGSGVTQALINDKALCDLSDIAAGLSLLPGALDNSFCRPYGDGKTYLLPFSTEMEGVWYNATATTKLPKTFEELLATEPSGSAKLLAFAGTDPLTLRSLFAPMLSSMAPDAYDGIFGIDDSAWDDESLQAMIAAIGAVKGGIADSDCAEYRVEEVVRDLATGTAVFGVLSDADLALEKAAELYRSDEEIADAIQKISLRFLELPAAYSRMVELYIPAESENIDIAKKFIKTLFDDADSAQKTLGAVPPKAGAAANMTESVQIAAYRVPSLDGASDNYERLLYVKFGNLLTGTMSAEQFVDQMRSAALDLKDYAVR